MVNNIQINQPIKPLNILGLSNYQNNYIFKYSYSHSKSYYTIINTITKGTFILKIVIYNG